MTPDIDELSEVRFSASVRLCGMATASSGWPAGGESGITASLKGGMFVFRRADKVTMVPMSNVVSFSPKAKAPAPAPPPQPQQGQKR